jgi:hypothetical protein
MTKPERHDSYKRHSLTHIRDMTHTDSRSLKQSSTDAMPIQALHRREEEEGRRRRRRRKRRRRISLAKHYGNVLKSSAGLHVSTEKPVPWYQRVKALMQKRLYKSHGSHPARDRQSRYVRKQSEKRPDICQKRPTQTVSITIPARYSAFPSPVLH